MPDEDPWVRQAVITQLESLRRAGIIDLERRPPTAEVLAPVAEITPTASARESTTSVATPHEAPPSDKETPLSLPTKPLDTDLSVIQSEVAACTQCSELAASRTQTVFGVGNPNARLVFLGEAPGADEDKQGEPFVGRAGQLLNKIIESCTLRREDVYILTILKCRPPGNRNPQPDEAAACRGFLNRQLALIQPEFICCLGAVAAQSLLEVKTPIGKLRGAFHNYQGMRVLCTYHPAYLLRDPSKKRDTWDDMQILMAAMGIELPKK